MTGVIRFVARAALAAFVIAAAWKALGPFGAAGAVAILMSSAVAGYRGQPKGFTAARRPGASGPSEPRPPPPPRADRL